MRSFGGNVGSRRGSISAVVFVFALLVFFGGLLALVIMVVKASKQNRVEIEVAEGVFERAEYIPGGFLASSITVVHFADGRNYVARGHISMPFPENTCIKIFRKSHDGYKYVIKRADE